MSEGFGEHLYESFCNTFWIEYECRKSEKDNTIDVELLEEETIEVIRDAEQIRRWFKSAYCRGDY